MRPIAVIVCLLLALAPSVGAQPMVWVFIDTTQIALDPPPLIFGGLVMKPLHPVLVRFGGGATWDFGTGVITVRRMPVGATEPETVLLRLGSPYATTKDGQIRLEAPPRAVGHWLYVPLTFFRDALGPVLDWDVSTLTGCPNGY